jgi:hypothetical protein
MSPKPTAGDEARTDGDALRTQKSRAYTLGRGEIHVPDEDAVLLCDGGKCPYCETTLGEHDRECPKSRQRIRTDGGTSVGLEDPSDRQQPGDLPDRPPAEVRRVEAVGSGIGEVSTLRIEVEWLPPGNASKATVTVEFRLEGATAVTRGTIDANGAVWQYLEPIALAELTARDHPAVQAVRGLDDQLGEHYQRIAERCGYEPADDGVGIDA